VILFPILEFSTIPNRVQLTRFLSENISLNVQGNPLHLVSSSLPLINPFHLPSLATIPTVFTSPKSLKPNQNSSPFKPGKTKLFKLRRQQVSTVSRAHKHDRATLGCIHPLSFSPLDVKLAWVFSSLELYIIFGIRAAFRFGLVLNP